MILDLLPDPNQNFLNAVEDNKNSTGWGKVQNELIYPDRANLAQSG